MTSTYPVTPSPNLSPKEEKGTGGVPIGSEVDSITRGSFAESASIQRKQEMLQCLIETMEVTHRRRRARRRVAICGGVALMGVVSLIPTSRVFESAFPGVGMVVRSVSPASRTFCEFIETDPTVLDRFAARRTGRAKFIDDQTLTQVLLSIDRPANVVREGNRIRLSAPVTDDELGI